MQFKIPKNTEKYYWTQHVVGKMHHYGLSEQKVLGVIRRPKRIETGIAPDTVAVMQVAGTIKKGLSIKKSAFANASARQLSPEGESWNQEIWVMYQIHPVKSAANRGLPMAEFNRVKNSKLKIPNDKQIPNDPLRQVEDEASKNSKLQELRNKIHSNKKITIISAWRYPGVSPQKDPIPAEIWREIEEAGIIK